MGQPWSNNTERKKIVANRGVPRNKKPLANILYKVEVMTEADFKSVPDWEEIEQYKFKDQGWLILKWQYQYSQPHGWNWHGYVTQSELKELLGAKQWAKFCEGKREFVEQRRIDGKNVKK